MEERVGEVVRVSIFDDAESISVDLTLQNELVKRISSVEQKENA